MGILGNSIPKTSYDIFIKCSNCKATGKRAVPKGTSIEEYMKSENAKCKSCGCKTIKQLGKDGMQVNPREGL